jgi:hypothetical protein
MSVFVDDAAERSLPPMSSRARRPGSVIGAGTARSGAASPTLLAA